MVADVRALIQTQMLKLNNNAVSVTLISLFIACYYDDFMTYKTGSDLFKDTAHLFDRPLSLVSIDVDI